MTTSAISQAQSENKLSLKPVLGEGRETRREDLQKIVQEKLSPMSGTQLDLLRALENTTDLKCRLLYVNNHPQGVIVWNNVPSNRFQNLPSALNVEHFYVHEKGAQSDSWRKFALEEVLDKAKETRAHSISIQVAKTAQATLEFLSRNSFRNFGELSPSTQIWGKILQAPRQPQVSGKKRGRDEEEASPAPEKIDSCPIMKKYFNMIRSGTKTIEGRINMGLFQKMRKGQKINFFNGSEKVLCVIERIARYPSFAQMLRTEGVTPCLPDVRDLQTAIDIYAKIPGYAAKEAQWGVLAIQIRKIS